MTVRKQIVILVMTATVSELTVIVDLTVIVAAIAIAAAIATVIAQVTAIVQVTALVIAHNPNRGCALIGRSRTIRRANDTT